MKSKKKNVRIKTNRVSICYSCWSFDMYVLYCRDFVFRWCECIFVCMKILSNICVEISIRSVAAIDVVVVVAGRAKQTHSHTVCIYTTTTYTFRSKIKPSEKYAKSVSRTCRLQRYKWKTIKTIHARRLNMSANAVFHFVIVVALSSFYFATMFSFCRYRSLQSKDISFIISSFHFWEIIQRFY